MTLKAPFHLQRGGLPHERHAIDSSVAGRTTDPFIDVDTVVEIGEIRQVMNARPLQRFVRSPGFADRLKVWTVEPDLRVAIHTGFDRGNARRRGGFNRGVAIPAIDADAADVVLVGKLHGLFFGIK